VNLSDLLAELRDNILNDRAQPYNWSDTTLVRYINEAQRRFATKGLVIRDATTAEVVQVTLEEGVTQYTLHPSILSVITARHEDRLSDLSRVGHSMFGDYTNANTFYWDPQMTEWPAGTPLAYTTDEQLAEDDEGSNSALSLRVFPEPSADAADTIIHLRVIRRPLDPLVTTNLSAVPEIPADHHIEMLDWAAYLALRMVDDDAGNPKRAAEFAAAFEAHVMNARKMVLRKLFVPQAWGFGRSGWSWGS
jgi:hypothetical protein